MTESDMTGSKLVFIDIDGTLADENHIVPESAKTACARAQANGHKLFICTGRSVPKIERNILDLGFDGVVSVAGAQANIGDKLLFQHLVSPEAIDAAMAYFAEHHIESYQWQGNAIHGIQAFCDFTTTDIHEDGLANAFKTLGLV